MDGCAYRLAILNQAGDYRPVAALRGPRSSGQSAAGPVVFAAPEPVVGRATHSSVICGQRRREANPTQTGAGSPRQELTQRGCGVNTGVVKSGNGPPAQRTLPALESLSPRL